MNDTIAAGGNAKSDAQGLNGSGQELGRVSIGGVFKETDWEKGVESFRQCHSLGKWRMHTGFCLVRVFGFLFARGLGNLVRMKTSGDGPIRESVSSLM